ncbi:type II toxin-antitoxin system VapC family toxin [Enterovirga aerilata]|uniref:Type II toxin-antitoxin system VapC family toxin n=1 Tax=Enterovirga aerilata TaxID=2730920 RepID=A0A849I241_9HYPH|nr:type II toxin-antitoxin system VapC family toxin [Enterovirga sp. DB1703]NNM73442.1 type II toxin-antitoxin system VapC family toxin [Enterovirga sp. DB1703]
MRLLLDSHTLLWWLTDDSRLSAAADAALADAGNSGLVSAASAWEIATKHRIGRLPDAAALVRHFQQVVIDEGFEPLSVTVQHAELAGTMDGSHKDPFDRMLVAQALVENLVLVSNESAFDAFGVTRLW